MCTPKQVGEAIAAPILSLPGAVGAGEGTEEVIEYVENKEKELAAAPSAPPPAPDPGPAPRMEDPSPDLTSAQKLRRLSRLRAGFLSTVKTSPGGTSTPPLVSTPSLYSSGTKDKLGQ